jgi:hypothetical protein
MNTHRTLILAGLLLAAGCQDKQVSTARGRADTDDHFGIVLSQEQKEQLRHDTAFGPERVTRDPFGLLHVTVPLRSAIQHTLYLEYRYSFFDGTGRLIEGPMGWTGVTLEAGSPGTIQFASTSNQAANFQLNIRYQR